MSALALLLIGLASLEAREIVMKHMKEPSQCKLCHRSQDSPKLVLLDGSEIAPADTPRLCGQCHGEKYGDWKEGMHGKSTGSWTSSRTRVTCTACHEPHSPKFREMKALAPPKRRRGSP